MTQAIINFVHANGFPFGSYRTFLSYLTDDFHCIGKAQYAHTPEYALNKGYDLVVNELIDYVAEQPQPVIGIGHSFGGVLTFMAAIKAPELFRGIVLLDPPIFTGPIAWLLGLSKHTGHIDKISPAGKAKIRRRQWPKGHDLNTHFGRSRLFKDFDPRCLQDYIDSGFVHHNDNITLQFDADIETEIFRQVPTNLAKYKGQLKVPSAFFYGEHTDVATPYFRNRFIKQHQGMQACCVKNGGHMFPLEQPEQVAQQIKAVINAW